MDLAKAFAIAEQDSPAPWFAKEALLAMRAEIERLQSQIREWVRAPDKVRPIRYLDSPAAMLRIWSDEIESGEIECPDSVLLILVHEDGRKPALFQTGTTPNNLVAIGALMHSIDRIMGTFEDD